MLSQKHYVIFSNNVLRENITRKQFKRWLGSQTALGYVVMRTQRKYIYIYIYIYICDVKKRYLKNVAFLRKKTVHE